MCDMRARIYLYSLFRRDEGVIATAVMLATAELGVKV